jgi:ATP-dependent Clp protease ATP-binding subunit ClpA
MLFELDLPMNRLAPATRRIVDDAVADAHRRGQAEVTTAHLFLACARRQWKQLAPVFSTWGIDGRDVLKDVEDAIASTPEGAATATSTRLVCRLAVHRATRLGKTTVDPSDLIAAILEEDNGVATLICAGTASTRRTSATRSPRP